jgi:glycosyltransferase involved in cell wall biosynthesis
MSGNGAQENSRTHERNKPLISVIIPVYNAGRYIEKLLESLFNQTLQNFEIIVAYDEKSTDDTFLVLSRIAKKHSLTIDSARDSSCGYARNRGFHLAEGDFTIFVDADDEIFPDYLESLYHVFELHPELSVAYCDHLTINEGDRPNIQLLASADEAPLLIIDRKTAIYHLIDSEEFRASWHFLVRRSYLIDHSIEFPNYSLSEDQVWSFQVIGNTDSVGYLSRKLYLHILRSQSITTTIDVEKRWQCTLQTMETLKPFLTRIDIQVYDDYYCSNVTIYCYYFATHCVDFKDFVTLLEKYELDQIPQRSSNTKILMASKLSRLLFNTSKKGYYLRARGSVGCVPQTLLEWVARAIFQHASFLHDKPK